MVNVPDKLVVPPFNVNLPELALLRFRVPPLMATVPRLMKLPLVSAPPVICKVLLALPMVRLVSAKLPEP